MGSFDFIDAATQGYRFFMIHIGVLARLAVIPVLLKVSGFVAAYLLDFDDNLLRQGLFLVPSFLAEGWVVAVAVRWAIYDDLWPVALTGNQKQDMARLDARAQTLLSAAVMFALVQVVIAAVSGVVMGDIIAGTAAGAETDTQTGGSGLALLVSLGILTAMIWGFRFLWMHVPLALDIDLKDYIRMKSGLSLSLSMIGTWLLCLIPLAAIVLLLLDLVRMGAGVDPDSVSLSQTVLLGTVQGFLDVAVAIISSVAIAKGIKKALA